MKKSKILIICAEPTTVPLCKQTMHKKIVDLGVPDDAMIGMKDCSVSSLLSYNIGSKKVLRKYDHLCAGIVTAWRTSEWHAQPAQQARAAYIQVGK